MTNGIGKSKISGPASISTRIGFQPIITDCVYYYFTSIYHTLLLGVKYEELSLRDISGMIQFDQEGSKR
jgi:hypothetical protein